MFVEAVLPLGWEMGTCLRVLCFMEQQRGITCLPMVHIDKISHRQGWVGVGIRIGTDSAFGDGSDPLLPSMSFELQVMFNSSHILSKGDWLFFPVERDVQIHH